MDMPADGAFAPRCLPARRFCLRRILEWRYGDCGASSRDAQRPRPLGECVPCTTRGYFPRSLVAPAWTLSLHLGSGKERERGPAAPGAGPSPAGPLAPARKWFRRAGARTDWKIRRLRSAGKKHVAFASAPPSGGGGCRPSLRGAVQAGDRPSAPPALSRSLPAA